jgi:tetratricopeptide (TPR) repeat protein
MDLEGLVNLSADYLEIGKGTEAERVCRQILADAPDHDVTWANLSYACILQGRFDEARSAAERAVTLDPLSVTGWHNLGESYLRLERPAEALTCQNRALVLEPDTPRLWSGRGSALMALERYGTARFCFEKALSLEPDYRAAQLNLQMARLLGDAQSRELLHLALGVAVAASRGEIEQKQAAAYARGMVEDRRVTPELVKQFDAMIELNEHNESFNHVAFAWMNTLLAHYVDDSELIAMTSARLQRAQALEKQQ